MFIEYNSDGVILCIYTCADPKQIITENKLLQVEDSILPAGSCVDINSSTVIAKPVRIKAPDYRYKRDNMLLASDHLLSPLLLPDSYPKMLARDKSTWIHEVKKYRQALRDMSFIEPVVFPAPPSV